MIFLIFTSHRPNASLTVSCFHRPVTDMHTKKLPYMLHDMYNSLLLKDPFLTEYVI